MSSKPLIVIACGGLLVAGCATDQRAGGSPDPAFGEAVKWNAATQTIDPNPVYSDQDAQPGGSGVKGAEAVKRYRTDTVKDVSVMTTTSNSGSTEPR